MKNPDDVWRRSNERNATPYKKAYKDKDGLTKEQRKRVDELKWKINRAKEEDIFA